MTPTFPPANARRAARFFLLALGLLLLAQACAGHGDRLHRAPSGDIFVFPATFTTGGGEKSQAEMEKIITAFDAGAGYAAVTIGHPYDGSVFPADMAGPLFEWQDPLADRWLLCFSPERAGRKIVVLSFCPRWIPGKEAWDAIKSKWTGENARVVIYGIGRDGAPLSRGEAGFRISRDRVAAPVLFQQIPLPFGHALKNTGRFKWRLADIGAYGKPKVVMENPPSCMFCHAVSGDGTTFGVDVDVAGDKGGYVLAKIEKEMSISEKNLISWNGLPHPENTPNMGLFSKISRDGKYLVSTVNEKPFMITMDHVDFSQLFFPITGRLAVFARESGRFFLLAGADDPGFVQTSPAWSPDGKHLVFARAKVDPKLQKIMGDKRVLFSNSKTHIRQLNKRYRIRYDLYSIPFNHGRGGAPVPIKGAAFNQKSNYFPRVSPDGQWIVFNQSDTGMVAQPTSALYIVPFGGGRARRMNCNTKYYNSWHAFSPNGRWLVFTSKVDTPYTQLFLTHIDENGMDTPPVLLARLHQKERAAVIPEFVNIAPADLQKIRFPRRF